MTEIHADLQAQLGDALGPRSVVERPLGRGGMATVYLARDLKRPPRGAQGERAYVERSGSIYGIKGSYLFVPLRGHPRFTALLRQMNLV